MGISNPEKQDLTTGIYKVILNPLYPLINRIRTAFVALLKPYGITVSLDEI